MNAWMTPALRSSTFSYVMEMWYQSSPQKLAKKFIKCFKELFTRKKVKFNHDDNVNI